MTPAKQTMTAAKQAIEKHEATWLTQLLEYLILPDQGQ